MSEWLGIVTAEHCYLRQRPGCTEQKNDSEIVDEIFSGWAVRIISEEAAECGTGAAKNGWVKVETHYGYKGYVRKKELRLTDREELQKRQDKARFMRINAPEADLLSRAAVQGIPRKLILKNALVEVLDDGRSDGWALVRTAAGREGYVHSRYLTERKDGDAYLLGDYSAEEGFFLDCCSGMAADEQALRRSLVQSALAYLGTQYRWGGKSSQGLDCSGLVFMSYLENGILIYRDAKIMPGYPMAEIPREALQCGDAVYFPGHMAMYLGEGTYIHATAYSETPYVTVNSLNPLDENYREDLADRICACGSIFGKERVSL